MHDRLSPFHVFLSAFSISSLGGLAAYLRSERELSTRLLVSAMLNSGLLGLAIAFCWYTYFHGRDNVYLLIGITLLSGLGGLTVVDFAIGVVKKGGLDIHIETKAEAKRGDDTGSKHTEVDDDSAA